MQKVRGYRGQAGESLVETLVAMTIAGLAMIMLAMAISVSSHIITQGADTAKTYYSNEAALAVPALAVPPKNAYVTVGNAFDSSADVAVEYDSETVPGGGEAASYRATERVDG